MVFWIKWLIYWSMQYARKIWRCAELFRMPKYESNAGNTSLRSRLVGAARFVVEKTDCLTLNLMKNLKTFRKLSRSRGKYFYLFADLGQGIVSVKSRNREKFLVVWSTTRNWEIVWNLTMAFVSYDYIHNLQLSSIILLFHTIFNPKVYGSLKNVKFLEKLSGKSFQLLKLVRE